MNSEILISLIKRMTLILIIIGCSEISAQPEVKSVAIQVGEQSPTGCQLLGRVTGTSKNNPATAGDNAPYGDRLIAARNNLRNETQQLGGNTVHIRHANNSGKYEVPGADKEILFIGDAYYCE